MTYTPNIPQDNQAPATSQSQLLGNFSSLDTFLGQDHVAPSSASSQCLHKKVTLVEPLGSDPSLSGSQAALYTKTVSGVQQLFFKKGSLVQQLSAAITETSSNAYIDLPGNLRMQWGRTGTALSVGTTTITFPVPFAEAPLSVIITPRRAGFPPSSIILRGVVVDSNIPPNTHDFRVITQNDNYFIYWFAIGKTI